MKLDFPEFVRLFPLRAKNISWLFGAGTSVSAGLPTAYNLIWDFKRRIYCSEQGLSLNRFSNLSDRGLRVQIQSYFDSSTDCPLKDSPQEYSYYFERAFPSPTDRKEYLEALLSGMQLSYGHKALGLLMKKGLVNLVFTTNFDKAFENTASQVFGNMEDWYKTDLDTADNGLQLFQSSKMPLIVKLHGDYLSDRLKNTEAELQTQDDKLRHILTTSSYTKGLGIMGYSGRDESVMEALRTSLKQDNSFPNGIFWFSRTGGSVMPAVAQFIEDARTKGVEAYIVEIETFDSAWGEITKGIDFNLKEMESLEESYSRKSQVPIAPKGKRSPMLRLNAIPMSKFPVTARLFKCEAGNTKEIMALMKSTEVDIVAIRKQQGIVGFGSDADFQKAFESYGEFKLDTFEIHERHIGYDDSSLKGLISQAAGRALVTNLPLKYVRRRSRHYIVPSYKHRDDVVFNPLRKELNGRIHGLVTGTSIHWMPCLEISLQNKMGNAYVLLIPSILATKSDNLIEVRQIAPFVKELMARWYNDKYDRILSHWIEILFGNMKVLTKTAFEPETKGMNAAFEFKKRTAYNKSI
jgi:hypothetical protein